nr:hypothetical protein [Tanacetum cinerariifolium]
ESPFTLDSTPTYVDESPNVLHPPPQPSIYPCEFCRNNAYYGHYCTPQAPLIYPEQCYNQDFNFQQNFQDDQMTTITSLCELACQVVQKKLEEKQLKEERAAKAKNWKLPVCYDDDDDEESSKSLKDNIISELPLCVAVTPNEPVDSLIMGDGYTTDEVIKSSVENLVPIPSEFEGIPDTMCVVHFVNNPTPLEAKDHLEIILNSNDDISSSDDDSLHEENIDSGSTTTHFDISLSKYDSFIFDLTHEEFVDELAHIISPPKYDRFYFKDLPDPGELMSVLNSRIRENVSTTSVNLPIEDDHSPLLAYVVWIFLVYLTYPVIPPYLYPFGNEDTIFDPGITITHFYSLKPVSSHRHGAFKKFNTHRSHL